MKKLFKVEVSCVVYVVAETETHADILAHNAVNASSANIFDTFSYPVVHPHKPPLDWVGALPFGECEGKTVEDWIKLSTY